MEQNPISSSSKEEIGNRIYELRKAKKLSQMQLAEIVGMSSNSISNIELGKQLCKSDKLSVFAKTLDTTVEYLVYGDEQVDDELDILMRSKFKGLNLSDKKRILAMLDAYILTA